ncbi:Predicted oxidoreductase of the aldo/keto reductase family [Burkholderia sp. YR290]|nr:Predicted oxidoreductase of the aldo/keto reductase family [Burkholderia sp. YR290]
MSFSIPGIRRLITSEGMRYRALGATTLEISAVGFGTCQLRMVPQQQAIDTLKRGFALGVNFVHTAPDYEGAEDLVAQAVAESGRHVIVFTQGYGDRAHFEWLFETACLRAGKRTLDVFGIACVEDRESLGENVWSRDGIVEFLLEKKRDGRLRAIFAESHGTPDYIAKLIRSGVFDAVLLAYNSLGFHALSYFPEPPATFEDIKRNKLEIFPLARTHNVSLLLMKSLGGGLLCAGKAFVPHARFSNEREPLSAGTVLRHLLRDEGITAVVPGTASVDEAEENARAGFSPNRPRRKSYGADASEAVVTSSREMLGTLCTRCGHCDALCSRQLPVSWLFRDAYISTIRAETFETLDRLQYFHLHQDPGAPCGSCQNVTCACPHGIDIPAQLDRVHDVMLELRQRNLLPRTPQQIVEMQPTGPWQVRRIQDEVPRRLALGARATCRLWLENAGSRIWVATRPLAGPPGLHLVVRYGAQRQFVALRHDVEPATRTHFVFDITAPIARSEDVLKVYLSSVEDPTTAEEQPICEFLVETSA